MEPRELVLREVRESPWLQQRELAARLSGETGMAESTLIRLFRRMEADGELQSGLDGRRKTYAEAEPEPQTAPTPGALWSRRLAPLGEPEPEPEPEAEPQPDSEPEPGPEPQPVGPPPEPPAYTRPAWPFAAVVAAVVAFAVIAAIVLSPPKNDPLTGGEQEEETRPASASQPPEPGPKPARPEPARPEPARPEPAEPAKPRVAVLSGVPEPGAAAKEARRLKRLGYRVAAVTNAPGPAERSSVLYARGERAAARSLAEAAGIGSVGTPDAETADAARGAKLVVVVGASR